MMNYYDRWYQLRLIYRFIYHENVINLCMMYWCIDVISYTMEVSWSSTGRGFACVLTGMSSFSTCFSVRIWNVLLAWRLESWLNQLQVQTWEPEHPEKWWTNGVGINWNVNIGVAILIGVQWLKQLRCPLAQEIDKAWQGWFKEWFQGHWEQSLSRHWRSLKRTLRGEKIWVPYRGQNTFDII